MTTQLLPVITPLNPDIYLDRHQVCDSNFASYSVYYLSNHLGKLRITVCDDCGYEFVECLHINNTVDTYNVKLVCLLCGGGI